MDHPNGRLHLRRPSLQAPGFIRLLCDLDGSKTGGEGAWSSEMPAAIEGTLVGHLVVVIRHK